MLFILKDFPVLTQAVPNYGSRGHFRDRQTTLVQVSSEGQSGFWSYFEPKRHVICTKSSKSSAFRRQLKNRFFAFFYPYTAKVKGVFFYHREWRIARVDSHVNQFFFFWNAKFFRETQNCVFLPPPPFVVVSSKAVENIFLSVLK